MPNEKYNLILVEDSEDELALFDLAFSRNGLDSSFDVLHRFRSAGAAIDYLVDLRQRTGSGIDPDIMVIDFGLRDRSGLEVIECIGDLQRKPVVGVFSGSACPEDKQRALDLGAALFQEKNFSRTDFPNFLLSLASLVNERRRRGEL